MNEIVSSEMRIKIKCKLLNKLNIAMNMLIKSCKMLEEDQPEIINMCKSLEEDESIKDEELLKLQKSVKESIMLAVIVSSG